MPYVPESQRDTRWWLWNKLFLCRVSNIKSMSVDYVRYFGMPASGDSFIDKQTANEMVTRMITINAMVDFFQKGVPVAVVNREDTKTIYELISKHLNAWRDQLANGLNNRNAPLDDLMALDLFASSVYAHAKYCFPEHTPDCALARRLASIGTMNKGNMFKPIAQKVTVISASNNNAEETKAPERPDRVSMAEIFASHASSRSQKWK